MGNLVEIDDLTIAYDQDIKAVNRVSLDVGHREIIGIVGESGSGKTTLIRSLINLLPPNASVVSGTIRFNGNNLMDYGKEQWRQLRGGDIAMIFQNPGSFLNPIIKVGRQFVESIRNHRPLTRKTAEIKAVQVLEKMDLKDPERVMDAYPFQLSGGMKQRVAIAMAVAMEPPLILADEPTSALDVKTQAQIIRELSALRQTFDTAIVMVTHNICCAAHMADRIMVMYRGRLVESGMTESVIFRPKKEYTRQLLSAVASLKGVER